MRVRDGWDILVGTVREGAMRRLALAFVWCVAAAVAMAVPRYDLMPWAGEPGKAYPPCEALRGEWVP